MSVNGLLAVGAYLNVKIFRSRIKEALLDDEFVI